MGANFTGVNIGWTILGNLDLSTAISLESVMYEGPTTIGIDTLARSRGKIPEAFLRGCGLAPWEVLSAGFYDSSLAAPQLEALLYKIFDG